jgi:TatD DNase family protein
MIDTHVNLHHEAFVDDLEPLLERALEAGITGMVSISDQIANVPAIAAITDRKPNFWRTVGAHPHYAIDHRDLTVEALVELAKPEKVIGIGETGLDFHYTYSPQEDQIAVFRTHIAASRTTGLPLVVHTREADQLTADILTEETEKGAFPILLHCYTSGEALLRAGLALGAFVSFSGIATFKNAQAVRDMAAIVPLDRLLVETDCPYLAPIPMRGRRNEPAYLPHVVAKLAEVKGVSAEAMAGQADTNFFALFRRAQLA